MKTDQHGRLRPCRGQWHRRRVLRDVTAYDDKRRHLVVLSSYQMADAPDDSGPTPTWQVSASRTDHAAAERFMPTDDDMRLVLDTFELGAWSEATTWEDNHSPGIARHLFIPVDETLRAICECKLTEPQAVTLDGVEWSNLEAETGSCPGCEIAAMPNGAPCQIHSLIGTTPEVSNT